MATKKPAKSAQPTVDDLKAPLLAAVGAADLALERVNEIVATLRERAGEARTDTQARVEESRARITKLQEDLPTQFEELRGRLSSEELRKVAESYAEAAQTRAVGERAAKLVGVELPAKKSAKAAPAKKAPAKKAPAKKAPAKKAAAKKVTQK